MSFKFLHIAILFIIVCLVFVLLYISLDSIIYDSKTDDYQVNVNTYKNISGLSENFDKSFNSLNNTPDYTIKDNIENMCNAGFLKIAVMFISVLSTGILYYNRKNYNNIMILFLSIFQGIVFYMVLNVCFLLNFFREWSLWFSTLYFFAGIETGIFSFVIILIVFSVTGFLKSFKEYDIKLFKWIFRKINFFHARFAFSLDKNWIVLLVMASGIFTLISFYKLY
jgi:hypothetical protein